MIYSYGIIYICIHGLTITIDRLLHVWNECLFQKDCAHARKALTTIKNFQLSVQCIHIYPVFKCFVLYFDNPIML